MGMWLPRCPYCGGRMLPQATQDRWISYVCSNENCRAVSPHDRSFNSALNKAHSYAGIEKSWINRDEYIPCRQDEYLCECELTRMVNVNYSCATTYYAVLHWDSERRMFDHEADGYGIDNQFMRVKRWIDFKGNKNLCGT